MDAWSSTQPVASTRTAEFMASVYRWMAFGLALTGIVAWAVTSSPTILSALYRIQDGHIVGQTGLMWIAIIAWFILGLAFTPVAMRASIGAQGGEERHALVGALALYLDFINLFLFLLRFMGRRRD